MGRCSRRSGAAWQPASHSRVAQCRAGLSLPSGKISTLVLRKLCHNNSLTAKPFRIHPNPESFLSEGGAVPGERSEKEAAALLGLHP